MEPAQLSLILSAVALALSVLAILSRNRVVTPPPTQTDTRVLRLQAYERLVLLTERIALPNLISRLAKPGLTAFEMKIGLIEQIKQEFEYNSTQQLFVSEIAWDAVRNLKEQNLALIHQVSASLGPDAGANELNKRLLELILQQTGTPLHEIVAKTLNQEAKILMK